MERVIALIDMDCFFVQVEQRERPELWGKPVVLASQDKEGAPGRIGVVSYEAQILGVERKMTISQARAVCPDLNVCFASQGEHLGKADMQKYRDASAEIFDVFNNFDERIVVERVSVDEAFLDMTELVDQTIVEIGVAQLLQDLTSNLSTILPTTHVADGNDRGNEDVYDREASVRNLADNIYMIPRCLSKLRLAVAAEAIEQIRARIKESTQFFCSGGIANNKMLAKLVCARHKPRQQTVIPFDFVPVLFEETPIGDVRMLGGKLGNSIQQKLGVGTMADLAAVPYDLIERHFGDQAQWISQLAKGLDDEPVKPRNNQLSIAVSKTFPGKNALTTVAEVRRWIEGLSKELSKRLVADQVKNKRTAENVIFGILNETHTSRTLKIGSEQWTPPVYTLSMSASRFTDGLSVQSQNIMEWIEKRLQLSEAGRGLFQPPSTAPPEPRIFVKGVLKRPADLEEPEVKVDEDGWQVYDPTKFESTEDSNHAPVLPAVELSDIGAISSSVYEELPANIKADSNDMYEPIIHDHSRSGLLAFSGIILAQACSTNSEGSQSWTTQVRWSS
ncbi:unnamed protein product [Cylicocyclus nassatus]|uniref:DNA polymerase eta n=1 Tax=Cylicocyclus nassatus TaxID=53992 RepID=A0AA36GS32_CYLNA|nr:unnamed protein product [Cylicocyclus nassatus]